MPNIAIMKLSSTGSESGIGDGRERWIDVKAAALAVVGALIVVLASCGGSTPVDKSTETKATPQCRCRGRVNDHRTVDDTQTTTVSIELGDDYFTPTFLKVAPNAHLTVSLFNTGRFQHTFTIKSQHVDDVLNPGQHLQVTVTAPASGSLQFHCRFHSALGMKGAFFVS